ncbi:hypothetical protein H0H87_002509 [Tephrocybe sp. NHM501043]|nr:hypothetical protein H0H87_002509 [Tephrocybe sp. NHM501043]
MDNLYTQWVHPQTQLLSDQNDADWSKDRSSASAPGASSAAESSLAAAALDISDFALGDMAGASIRITKRRLKLVVAITRTTFELFQFEWRDNELNTVLLVPDNSLGTATAALAATPAPDAGPAVKATIADPVSAAAGLGD